MPFQWNLCHDSGLFLSTFSQELTYRINILVVKTIFQGLYSLSDKMSRGGVSWCPGTAVLSRMIGFSLRNVIGGNTAFEKPVKFQSDQTKRNQYRVATRFREKFISPYNELRPRYSSIMLLKCICSRCHCQNVCVYITLYFVWWTCLSSLVMTVFTPHIAVPGVTNCGTNRPCMYCNIFWGRINVRIVIEIKDSP